MNAKDSSAVRQYHEGNVAEDLKVAAARILEAERVEDISVRRLAREVGVTPANFYNHFPSLNDLLLDIAADGFLHRARLLAHIRRTSKTRAAAVRRAMLSYLDAAVSNYQLFRLMFGLLESQSHQAFQEAADTSMAELVEMVYGAPIFDPQDRDGNRQRCQAAYGLLAMGYGLARIVAEGSVHFSPEKRAEMRQFFEGVVDSYLGHELLDLIDRP